ncbi:MAG: hypothetical protein NC098_04820 [Lachnoclostridium sp.]|nr:hypothetical protein [Lachnoclostridium sp.]
MRHTVKDLIIGWLKTIVAFVFIEILGLFLAFLPAVFNQSPLVLLFSVPVFYGAIYLFKQYSRDELSSFMPSLYLDWVRYMMILIFIAEIVIAISMRLIWID